MARSIKLALVGCGWISGNHVNGYKDLFEGGCREFEVTACCDLDEVKARETAKKIAEFQKSEPKIFSDLKELIKSGSAEAADICVPHCFHHSTAIPLLEGGMHVMLEKPLGITIKASEKIIEAAKKAGRVLTVAENVRRDLTARSAAWLMNQKKLIGDIHFVNVQHIQYAPFDYDNPAFKWRGSKLLTGGGMIMDSGAHFGDMVQVLFGDVDEVNCTMQTIDRRLVKDVPIIGEFNADVEDTWHATIKFKNGIQVLWVYSRSLYDNENVRIANYYGSKGVMKDLGWVFHPFQGGAEAYLADGTRLDREQIQKEYMKSLSEDEKNILFPYGVSGGFAIEAWDFVNAVAIGREPEMNGQDAIKAKALCEACYESATIGIPVKFDDVISGKICQYQKPINDFWNI